MTGARVDVRQRRVRAGTTLPITANVSWTMSDRPDRLNGSTNVRRGPFRERHEPHRKRPRLVIGVIDGSPGKKILEPRACRLDFVTESLVRDACVGHIEIERGTEINDVSR